MSIRRFLASSSFWIVGVYVLFYLVTVLGFLALLFSVLGSEIENSLKSEIEREHAQIISGIDDNDIADMVLRVKKLAQSADPATAIYILKDNSGATLATNYPPIAVLPSGWSHLPQFLEPDEKSTFGPKDDRTAHTGSEHDEGYVGWTTKGPHYTLFVGRSLERIDEAKDILERLAFIILPLSLFLATLGGIIFGRITTRRIEVINQQCRTIRQRGDISLRIPNDKPDDEYGLLIANINAMLETIDRSIKNVQEVSDDVAHDLRTPLTRIKYSLETGLSKPDATQNELRHSLETACSETDRVLETFSAILRISQLNTGLRKARFETFDIAALISTISEAYEPTAEEKGHTLTLDCPPHICMTHGDKDMIGQLVSNLIENCFEHAGDRLDIRLGVICETNAVHIFVQDNGTGIAPEEHKRIFDKFYRVDKSRSETGSGLGLAIVKAITDLHGGKIQVESAAPGTKFLVTLPRGDISGR